MVGECQALHPWPEHSVYKLQLSFSPRYHCPRPFGEHFESCDFAFDSYHEAKLPTSTPGETIHPLLGNKSDTTGYSPA